MRRGETEKQDWYLAALRYQVATAWGGGKNIQLSDFLLEFEDSRETLSPEAKAERSKQLWCASLGVVPDV